MKKRFLGIIIILCFVVGLFGQIDERRSKLEELNYKPGIYVRKKVIKIDEFKGMGFSVVKVHNLEDGTYFPGLEITKAFNDGYHITTERVFIDNDDIDNFQNALNKIEESISKNEKDWEVIFRSLGGFSMGYKYNEEDKEWQAYISSMRYRPESIVWLDINEFKSFKKLMNKCIKKF
jgi:hypothetical protein